MNYLLGEGTKMKISEIDYNHPISDFLNSELPYLKSKVYLAFLFNVKTSFFSKKQIFLSFCYKIDTDKEKWKPELDKLLHEYINTSNDSGINIVDLCLNIDSEADFIKYLESQIKPIYSLL